MSGVNIYLNRENYEEQIIKHGSYVMWKASQACPCVDDESNSPDPNCELCGGSGYIYYDKTEFSVKRESIQIINNVGYVKYGNILSIDRIYADDLFVIDYYGNQIIFNKIIGKSQNIEIDYTYTNFIKQCNIEGIYKGHGIIEVPSLWFQSIRGSKISYELVNVSKMENLNTGGDILTFIDAFKNFILVDEIDTSASIGDKIMVDAEYIKPHLMLISGISEKMRRNSSYMLPEAEASLTVPNHIMINEGDIFTLSMSEQAFSLVKEFHKDVDVLDHYDVSKILNVVDKNGVEYEDGVHFIQISRDKIKVLDSIMLLGKYSIKYLYRVMFKAMSNLPSLRYGENQPMPRRIMLKQYSRTKSEPLRGI